MQGRVGLPRFQWRGTSCGRARRATLRRRRPALVVYNEGTNDGSRNVTEAFLQIVRNFSGNKISGTHLLLVPFNGGHKADIQLVVDAMKGSGTTVVYGDTTGFYDGSDGLHPFGYNHMAFIAPKVAELCLPLLTQS
jgi:hypothetical protein